MLELLTEQLFPALSGCDVCMNGYQHTATELGLHYSMTMPLHGFMKALLCLDGQHPTSAAQLGPASLLTVPPHAQHLLLQQQVAEAESMAGLC